MNQRTLIKTSELVYFPQLTMIAPARIDTGAYHSAVWASDIRKENGRIYFKLLGPKSVLYTGQEYYSDTYRIVSIKNSFGHREKRYCVPILMKICNRKFNMWITLANRENQKFPVLIGRKLLKNRFVVLP